jgi:CRP/FNR family transcriptional regulator, cyclic AMP receptor protein
MNRETLRRLPLFEGLADDDLERLDEMVHERPIEPGELLMAQGDPGDAVYVVLDGEFEITKRSNDQEFVLAVRGAGEVLGEMALLENAPRTASTNSWSFERFVISNSPSRTT